WGRGFESLRPLQIKRLLNGRLSVVRTDWQPDGPPRLKRKGPPPPVRSVSGPPGNEPGPVTGDARRSPALRGRGARRSSHTVAPAPRRRASRGSAAGSSPTS